MSDPLTAFLESGNEGIASLDPDLLKLAGKRAAAAFLVDMDGDEDLVDKVAAVAAEIPGVQNEHIRRICEFANLATNDALFRKEAAAKDGRLISTDFTLAEPGEVIKRLNDGTKVAHIVVDGEMDYALPPDQSIYTNEHDRLLQELFLTKTAVAGSGQAEFTHPLTEHGETHEVPLTQSGEVKGSTPDIIAAADRVSEPRTKLLTPADTRQDHRVSQQQMDKEDPKLQKISAASVAYPRANPHHDLFAQRRDVEDNLAHVSANADGMEVRAEGAWGEFCGLTKRAMLDGSASFRDVVQVCETCCSGDRRLFETTITKLSENLMAEKVATYQDLNEELEKTASTRVLNPQSELVQACAAFHTFIVERAKLAAIASELRNGLQQIDEYVRDNLAPASAAAGGSF